MRSWYRALLVIVILAVSAPAWGQPEPIREWRYVRGLGASEFGLASDIAVDDAGNAYVTGAYAGAGSTRDDIIVLKLSPEGDVLWEDVVAASPSWDGGHAVALDGQGHLYVVADESGSALLLRKYTTGGALVWQQRYQRDGLGLSASEGAYLLALDGAGHVYVAATGYGEGGPGSTSADISVARFTTDGALTWEHVYDGNGDYNQQNVNAIAVAPDGGLYVAGGSAIDDLGPKFLVYRLTPSGTLAWDLLVSGDDRGGDSGVALALGSDGSVYVAGLVSNVPGGTRDATLVRVAPDGALLWRRDFDNPDFPGNGPDGYRGLAVDGDGNAYATGATWYGFTTQYHDVLVTKYAPDGTLLWWDHVDAPGYTRDFGHHVLLDAEGRPLVVAEVKNMEGLHFTHALVKYDAEGARLWAEVGEVATDLAALFHGAALGPGGDLYVAGFYHSPVDTFERLAVARYRDAVAPSVAAQPVGGTVVIPAGGGAFRFTATVANPSGAPMALDVWTEVEGPLSRSPVVGPRSVSLAPGASVTRTLRQPVPTAAPPGTYTYRVHAGVYPDHPYDTAAFAFEKLVAPEDGVKVVASDAAARAEFGTAVALDGGVAVVGAPYTDENRGAAYVFRRDGDVWQEEARLDVPGLAIGDRYGMAVAVRGDVAIVGAPHTADSRGAAYVFRYDGGAWVQEAQLLGDDTQTYDQFGAAVALDGDRIALGATQPFGTGPGAAYLFRHDGAAWVQEARLAGDSTLPYDLFGAAVALRGDVALVGAPHEGSGDCGAAYVYRRSGSEWAQEDKLLYEDCGVGGRPEFGASLALHGDLALVGAKGFDAGSATERERGAVYVFRHTGGIWAPEGRLMADDVEDYDRFGASVALDGDLALIGADGDDDLASGAGAAYVFRVVGTTWTQEDKLTASDTPGTGDALGSTVALEGGFALLGAPKNDEAAFNAGAAYVYDLSAGARSAAPVAAHASSTLPARFAITAAAPNPFTTATRIAIDVPEAQRVTVAVFDALGRRVTLLHDGEVEAGTHALIFDGRALPSGVYVLRVVGEFAAESRRLTLIR